MAVQDSDSQGPWTLFYNLFPWFAGLQIVLVVILMWQVMHPYVPPYQAISPKGDKLPLVAHTDPSMLPGVLLRWAGLAAVAAYTFDFVSYRQQTEQARQWFTPSGWQDYQRSLTELLKTITQRQLFVNSVVSAPPVIARTDESGWDIQLPFMVTYQSSENSSQKPFLIKMRIVRVPTSQNPSGLGVAEFVMASSK